MFLTVEALRNGWQVYSMIRMLVQVESVLTVTLITAIIALAIVLIFGVNAYRLKQNSNYSFLDQFPFEISQGVGASYALYIHILMLLYTVASVFFGFYIITKPETHFSGLTFLVSWSLTSAVIYLIFITKFTSVKRHLFVSALLFILTVINGVMAGLYYQFSPAQLISKVPSIISYLLAFFALLLALNPRLSKWSMMDKIEQQDGSIIVLRPKIFVLAVTEWLLILLNVLIMINAYFAYFLS